MPLDLWQHNADTAVADAARRSAPDFPVTFDESFASAAKYGETFVSSVNASNARLSALDDTLSDIRRTTGVDLFSELDPERPDFNDLNAAIRARRAKDPSFPIDEISEDEINKRALNVSQSAAADYAAMQRREKTVGGKVGMFLGGAASGAADPLNILALPVVAPEGLPILASMGIWAGIGASTQALSEAVGGGFREQVQPGYQESGQPVGNIIEAGLFAGGTAGLIHSAAAAWERVATGSWPRSVRDAGNTITSEANIQNINAYQPKEQIVSPAVKVDGQVFTGGNHIAALENAAKARGDTVDNIIDQFLARDPSNDGWVTNRGRFVDRQEGLSIAKSADQLGGLEVIPEKGLGIENLKVPNGEGVAAEVAHRDAMAKATDDILKGEPVKVDDIVTPEIERTAFSSVADTDLVYQGRPASQKGQPQQSDYWTTDRDKAATYAGPGGNILVARLADMPESALASREGSTLSTKKLMGSGEPFQIQQVSVLREESAQAPELPFPPVAPARTSEEMPLPQRQITSEETAKTLQSPDHMTALQGDIDRARATADVKIPVAVDENGEPVFRSVDSAMNEVESYKTAAEQIQACVNPPKEEGEAA